MKHFQKTLLDESEAVCNVCAVVGPRREFRTVYHKNIRYDFCPECSAKQVK
ncbi:MAG: hypothetical protein QXF95_08025 [Candidatus Caldarchaeum sp.]